MRRTRLKPTATLTIDPKPQDDGAPANRSTRVLTTLALALVAVAAAYVFYEPPSRLVLGFATAFIN
jgi:hypothetical protein